MFAFVIGVPELLILMFMAGLFVVGVVAMMIGLRKK
jgi:hypothetical protein